MLSTSAFASGFGLRDASASTLGVSYAGNAANGTVPTTMVFNPATVNDVGTFDFGLSNTGLLPQTSADFTATIAYTPLAPNGQPVSGTKHPVDIVNTALIPSFAVRYRLTDKLAIGMQFSTPWGMITNYKPNPVTRYYATMSDVKTANAMFIAGYQVTPELSVGGGLQVQYMKGRLSKAIDVGTISLGLYGQHVLPFIPGTVPGGNDGFVELRAQNWSTGWIVGAEWKPRSDLSFGVSYRSAVYNRLKGNEYFTLDTVGNTLKTYTHLFEDGEASGKLHNPPIVTLGAKWDIDPQWSVMVGADWTGWSIVKTLTIHSHNPVQKDDVTPFHYHDTWFGSLGVQYKPTDDWKLSVGTGFDDTPTDTAYRTPGIPDGGRYWLSAGVGYRLTPSMDVDLSVARLIAQKGNIALKHTNEGNELRGDLTGTVNMRVTLIGLELNYHL